MSTKHLLIAVPLLLVAVGCGKSKEAQLEGKWKLKDLNTGQTGPQAELAKSMMKSVTVEFKKDKKFSMTMIFPIEGTWSVEGSTVSMKVSSMMGMSLDQVKDMAKKNPQTAGKDMSQMDKPMTGTLSEDGKTLTLNPSTGQTGSMTFTKDESGS